MTGISIFSREHKFKAKERAAGQWVYGNLLQNQCYVYICTLTNNKVDTISVFPDTVCECTELQDFSGMPVYEFDIVGDPMQILDDMIVVWHDGAFRLLSFKQKGDTYSFAYKDIDCIQSNFDSLHLQVKGNVFNNDVLIYNLELFDCQSMEDA